MSENLAFWLLQIVEDDPVPYEIKHIIFVYDNFSLFVGGTENAPNNNNMFDYFPLEAQYFDYVDLYKIKSFDVICNVIDEAFSNDYLKDQLKNKKIYFAKFGNTPKFLFEIK